MIENRRAIIEQAERRGYLRGMAESLDEAIKKAEERGYERGFHAAQENKNEVEIIRMKKAK